MTSTQISGCVIHRIVTPQAEQPSKKNFSSLAKVISRSGAKPERAAAMAEARKWASKTLCEQGMVSIKQLRLSKGWSQTELASRVETTQPYIARIESGQDNITLVTCRKMAKALGVDLNTLDTALRAHEAPKA